MGRLAGFRSTVHHRSQPSRRYAGGHAKGDLETGWDPAGGVFGEEVAVTVAPGVRVNQEVGGTGFAARRSDDLMAPVDAAFPGLF